MSIDTKEPDSSVINYRTACQGLQYSDLISHLMTEVRMSAPRSGELDRAKRRLELGLIWVRRRLEAEREHA
jgi:hypothetical protein